MIRILLTLIFISVSSAFLVAQDTLHPSFNSAHSLNGHSFPSVITFKSPFNNTGFRGNIDIGQTSKLTIPGIKIGDYEIPPFDGKLLFVSLGVNYDQRFNPWLSMYISAQFVARLGANMSTILVDGLNTMTGGEIGWRIKIYQGKRVCLAATLGLRNMTGNFINVKEYFEELIKNNPDPSVGKVIPAMSAGAGVHFAYAMSRTFGMQISSSYAFGESFSRGENEGYLNCGIAFDVDFYPAKRVPIGLMLGYDFSSVPEILLNYNEPVNLGLAMISYTGSQDFELGLQYRYNNMNSENYNEPANVHTASIVFKYYF
jgi:hypothetical protein